MNAISPPSVPRRSPAVSWIVRWAIIAALVQLIVLWLTRIPLGVPQEWTWARIEFTILDWGGIWLAVVVGAGLCLFVRWGSQRIRAATNSSCALLLMLLWLAGTVWILSIVSSVPGIAGLSRAPFVLYYTRSSGYFTQAREDVTSLRQFLSTYHARIQDSSNPENYLHMGTHPPGLTTAFVAIIQLCERSSVMRNALLATQPSSVREGDAIIAQHRSGVDRTTLDVDAAALWLATLIVALMAAGTCVPLYLLARRTASREAAWWTAAFWLLVPAVAIFLPKSDVMFPCLTMWLQWLWLEGVDRRSWRLGVAVGAMVFLALCLSLAFVPVGLMLVLQGIFVSLPATAQPERRWFEFHAARWNIYLGSGAVFGLLIIAARLGGGINLVEVWLQNLRNHAAFYAHATRTYFPWLVINPLELSFALGLPLAGLAMVGLWSLLMKVRPWRVDLLIPILIWAVLWVSGKNMGEAARLWIFLMPYAVWLTAVSIDRTMISQISPRWLTGCYLLQMIVCVGMVIRIDGFHFAELLR